MPLSKADNSGPIQPVESSKKTSGVKAESLLAAGGTATGSLLIWLISQVVAMESQVQRLSATQNVLVDEEGLIRPSTTAIRAEIRLEEMYARLDRLERTAVIKGN